MVAVQAGSSENTTAELGPPRLPIELLLHIFDLALGGPPSLHGTAIYSRNRLLLTLSLVSRASRAWAQRALFSLAFVGSLLQTFAKVLEQSPELGIMVEELVVDYSMGDHLAFAAVLPRCRRLRNLVVTGGGVPSSLGTGFRLDTNGLSLATQLVKLTIVKVHLFRPPSPIPSGPRSRLPSSAFSVSPITRLSLQASFVEDQDTRRGPLFPSLVALSLDQSSLNSGNGERVTQRMPLPRLKAVHYTTIADIQDLQLRSSTALRFLSLPIAGVLDWRIFTFFPQSISHLRLHGLVRGWERDVGRALVAFRRALEEPKSLGFATLRRVYLPNEVENMTGEALENWRDMRRVAARRGVEVVLEKSPWHRAEERFWELWDEMEAREGRLLE